MSNPDRDQKAGTEDGVLHCLECGAELPADATRCTECGNERLILPTRWAPPDSGKPPLAFIGGLGRESRVLVGMTLALFCALILLGFAAAGTNAKLSGKSDNDVEIVMANRASTESQPVGNNLPEDSVDEVAVDGAPENIDELRAQALEAERNGAWFDAIDLWSEATNHADARLDDFLSLAEACEHVDDTHCAAMTLNRACVRFPEHPQGYLALGSLHERLGNLESARFQYEVGLGYCPGDPGLRQALRRVESELGVDGEEREGFDWQQWAEDQSIDSGESEPSEPDDVSDSGSDDSQSGSDGDSSGQDEGTPAVTLIGDNADENDTEDRDTLIAENDTASEEALAAVVDLRVLATSEQVTIELITDEAVAFSTSNASDPSRLIIRIPDARIATGSADNVALNVPLVERVNLIESSTDNRIVVLVVYLGENTRHSVASEGRTVRVTVWTASGTESG